MPRGCGQASCGQGVLEKCLPRGADGCHRRARDKNVDVRQRQRLGVHTTVLFGAAVDAKLRARMLREPAHGIAQAMHGTAFAVRGTHADIHNMRTRAYERGQTLAFSHAHANAMRVSTFNAHTFTHGPRHMHTAHTHTHGPTHIHTDAHTHKHIHACTQTRAPARTDTT